MTAPLHRRRQALRLLHTRSDAPAWLPLAPAIFVVLWATGFIGARLSAADAEPLSFLTFRFLIAAALLAAAAVAAGATWPDRRGAVHAIVAGALIHGGYLGCIFWSIARGLPAGVSALIVGLQPLMTALVAGPLLGDRMSARHWLGLGLGIVGIGLVVWPQLTFSAYGITPANVAASVLATVSITLGSIYQKRHAASFDLRSGNALQFAGAAAVVGIAAATTESFAIRWTGEVLFAMAWLVLVLSIGAISLLYVMIRHGEVSRIAALFYLVPAVTAALAWALFGESLTPVQIVGMAVCAGAVMLATRAG